MQSGVWRCNARILTMFYLWWWSLYLLAISCNLFIAHLFDADWLDSDDAMCWLYHLLDLQFLRDHHLLLLPPHHLYSSFFLFSFHLHLDFQSSFFNYFSIWHLIFNLFNPLAHLLCRLCENGFRKSIPSILPLHFFKIILGSMKMKLCFSWLVWTSMEAPKLVMR